MSVMSLLKKDLKEVDSVTYESTIQNFNKRPDRWEEAQRNVEMLLDEADLDEVIGDYGPHSHLHGIEWK